MISTPPGTFVCIFCNDDAVCVCNMLTCICPGIWGAKYFCGVVMCGEIAAARHREEEEKQRKKAKLAAKLRKLMEAEAKSERKRLEIHLSSNNNSTTQTITGKNQIENTRVNGKRKERKRRDTKHMQQNLVHLHQVMKNNITWNNKYCALNGIVYNYCTSLLC